MDYNLAKELKEAGLNQTPVGFYYYQDSHKRKEQSEQYPFLPYMRWRNNDELDDETGAYVPTLSELIEACGEQFRDIAKTKEGWKARAVRDEGENDCIFISTQGTPEEAVARLWLSLHAGR